MTAAPKEGSMPPIDRDALLKELTFAGNDPGHAGQISGAPTNYKGDRSMGRWIADAVMVGPIFSAILAQADTAAQAVADRDADPNEVTPDMLAAAWEVVRDRYPHGRVLGPGPGFREAIAAALARRPLCDLEARIVEAETTAEVDREFAETSRQQATAAQSEVARLSAEVGRLRAALKIATDALTWLRAPFRNAPRDGATRLQMREVAQETLDEIAALSVPSTDAPAAAQEGSE